MTSDQAWIRVAVQEGLTQHQMDVKTTYLHAPMDCEVQGLDNETETPLILVWEVSWLNWTSLVVNLH